MAYEDPRLVAPYDLDNPDGPDHDHWRALADEVSARAVLDLGCGTGILTVTLVDPGRRLRMSRRAESSASTRRPQCSTGETVVEEMTLAFRTPAQLRADLTATGFTIREVASDWSGAPFTGTEPLMIVRADADGRDAAT